MTRRLPGGRAVQPHAGARRVRPRVGDPVGDRRAGARRRPGHRGDHGLLARDQTRSPTPTRRCSRPSPTRPRSRSPTPSSSRAGRCPRGGPAAGGRRARAAPDLGQHLVDPRLRRRPPADRQRGGPPAPRRRRDHRPARRGGRRRSAGRTTPASSRVSDRDRFATSEIELGKGIAGRAVLERRVIRTGDYSDHEYTHTATGDDFAARARDPIRDRRADPGRGRARRGDRGLRPPPARPSTTSTRPSSAGSPTRPRSPSRTPASSRPSTAPARRSGAGQTPSARFARSRRTSRRSATRT